MNQETIIKAFDHLDAEQAAEQLYKVKRFVLKALADESNKDQLNNLDSGLFDGVLIIEDIANILRKHGASSIKSMKTRLYR